MGNPFLFSHTLIYENSMNKEENGHLYNRNCYDMGNFYKLFDFCCLVFGIVVMNIYYIYKELLTAHTFQVNCVGEFVRGNFVRLDYLFQFYPIFLPATLH